MNFGVSFSPTGRRRSIGGSKLQLYFLRSFLAIIIPIIVLIGGIFSFKRFNEIKDEAQRYVEEIKARRDEANSLLKGADAFTGTDPDKASEIVENVQRNPDSSPIDRAVAAALLLQQRNRIEEARQDFEMVPNLAQAAGNADLTARAERALENLDRGEAP